MTLNTEMFFLSVFRRVTYSVNEYAGLILDRIDFIIQNLPAIVNEHIYFSYRCFGIKFQNIWKNSALNELIAFQ